VKAISSNFGAVRIYVLIALILIPIGSVIILFSFNLSSYGSSGAQPSGSNPVSLKSRRWAGYAGVSNLLLRQSEVTAVAGSWVVPEVALTESDTYSSVWVGIGGFGEGSLIQTGTEQECIGGLFNYYAWYEFLPNRAVRIQNFTVTPGDKIVASITLTSPNENVWTVTISNLARGESFLEDFVYNSSKLSAEWVVEAPSLNGQVATLSNFGSVSLSECSATIAGTTGGISSFPGYQLVLYDSQGVQLVEVSALNADGSSFNVTYSIKTVA
jgi:hypothetical protein